MWRNNLSRRVKLWKAYDWTGKMVLRKSLMGISRNNTKWENIYSCRIRMTERNFRELGAFNMHVVSMCTFTYRNSKPETYVCVNKCALWPYLSAECELSTSYVRIPKVGGVCNESINSISRVIIRLRSSLCISVYSTRARRKTWNAKQSMNEISICQYLTTAGGHDFFYGALTKLCPNFV